MRDLDDSMVPWEVERDRFGLMFSGDDVEVGEAFAVVPMTWRGLLAILHRFTGESGDPGSVLAAALGDLARLREEPRELVQTEYGWGAVNPDGSIERGRLFVVAGVVRFEPEGSSAREDARQ